MIDGEAAELCGYLLQCIEKADLGIGCKERIGLDVEGGKDRGEQTGLFSYSSGHDAKQQ